MLTLRFTILKTIYVQYRGKILSCNVSEKENTVNNLTPQTNMPQDVYNENVYGFGQIIQDETTQQLEFFDFEIFDYKKDSLDTTRGLVQYGNQNAQFTNNEVSYPQSPSYFNEGQLYNNCYNNFEQPYNFQNSSSWPQEQFNSSEMPFASPAVKFTF